MTIAQDVLRWAAQSACEASGLRDRVTAVPGLSGVDIAETRQFQLTALRCTPALRPEYDRLLRAFLLIRRHKIEAVRFADSTSRNILAALSGVYSFEFRNGRDRL